MSSSRPPNGTDRCEMQGWDDGHWFPLAVNLPRARALELAAEESSGRCDVRVVDRAGRSIARWLMGDRPIP